MNKSVIGCGLGLGLPPRHGPTDPFPGGHSNGGMMAHRLGEELPNRIAAIVSVAGAHIPESTAARQIPVMQIHSIDDPRALYAGGLGPPFPFTANRVLHPPVEATLAASANGTVAMQRRQKGSSASPASRRRGTWSMNTAATARKWPCGN
jgi:poly(3-hydroxybutyrate) depolymerase